MYSMISISFVSFLYHQNYSVTEAEESSVSGVLLTLDGRLLDPLTPVFGISLAN